MLITTEKPVTPSVRLMAVLEAYQQVLVIMHDNPDPDAIATGWAILCLIEERLGKPVRLIGGGAIVRAEKYPMLGMEQRRRKIYMTNCAAAG